MKKYTVPEIEVIELKIETALLENSGMDPVEFAPIEGPNIDIYELL